MNGQQQVGSKKGHMRKYGGIVAGKSYARVGAAVDGLRAGQVVEIVSMFPDQNAATFRTSVGRLTKTISTDYTTPEGGKFRMLTDFGPFKENEVLVTFEEEDNGSGNVELYNFQGKRDVVPTRFVEWVG